MRRSGLAYCADVDPKRLDLLGQRGQLPFPKKLGNTYTVKDAFRLRLMLDLIEEHGAHVEQARAVAVSGPDTLPHDPLSGPCGASAMWVGLVSATEPDDPLAKNRSCFCVGGQIEDLPRLADERLRDMYAAYDLKTFIAVNASRAAGFVLRRALEVGSS